MGKRRTNFSDSLINMKHTYAYYIDRLTELALVMFEWKNLPDTVDERYLELTLFQNGQAIFFKDEVLGYLGLQCAVNGNFDVYRVPLRRKAYASNGYQNNDLDIDNSVIIYNNYLRTNSVRDIKMFAQRLYDLDCSIDVNARAQKTPVLIQCDEDQRLTMLNAYKEFDGNSPVIFADKNLDINGIKVFQTNAPYVSDKLYQLKTQYFNEALTYLGISNVNFEKKERLVSDEVSRQQGGVIASRYSRLEMRRKACDKINKMFGLNIDVDYREDFREIDDELMLTGQTGDAGMKTTAVDVRTRQ